jgi:tripartite ATP-independent periplasmic transporter solute receptor, DctP family
VRQAVKRCSLEWHMDRRQILRSERRSSIYQIWQQKTVPRIWKWIFIRVVCLEQSLPR